MAGPLGPDRFIITAWSSDVLLSDTVESGSDSVPALSVVLHFVGKLVCRLF